MGIAAENGRRADLTCLTMAARMSSLLYRALRLPVVWMEQFDPMPSDSVTASRKRIYAALGWAQRSQNGFPYGSA